ncbi:hypothetical protein [Zoogloea sp. LCSB751]|uniref:hypothetical protein n=1 Tax=Zoogloea sp. LCSB751 TaxID=1965277 RepID=UPI0009A4B79B|nr:hypothetical protein [Zoogloea sp. LCSB751]
MRRFLLVAACLLASPVPADEAASAGFCLFPLPSDSGVQRWINLGIVQYVDVRPDEVRIYFGGGNLGSGHEARIPAKGREEADALLARLRRAAAACAKSNPANPANSGGTP